MRSLTTCLAFVASLALIASSEHLTPIPYEGPYLASNVAHLSHTVPNITTKTIGKLLNVIDKYELTKYFGVAMLHQHFHYPKGKVVYETENNFNLTATLRDFSDIEDNATPYTYRVAQIKRMYQMLPIDYGPISESAKVSRQALANAVQKGFLGEFYTALARTSTQDNAGLGLILDIHRAALADGKIVLNNLSEDHSHTLAIISSKADINVTTATSFYTRSDSGAVQPLQYCPVCDDDGNIK